MAKKLLLIFILAFLFNFLWEHWHVQFYASYQGGAITDWILFRSAFFVDAVAITVFAFLVMHVKRWHGKAWPIVIPCLIFSAGLELYAQGTSRWVYAASMPLIPLLNIGLTPTVQLPVLGYVAYKLGLSRVVNF